MEIDIHFLFSYLLILKYEYNHKNSSTKIIPLELRVTENQLYSVLRGIDLCGIFRDIHYLYDNKNLFFL